MEGKLKKELLGELKSLSYGETLDIYELTERTSSSSPHETQISMEKVMEENRITFTPYWEYRMGR